MSRIPKSTYEDIAMACDKLAQDGRLTLGNLRSELGGGGQEYLAGHYRTWLQKRRESLRVPFENLVSEGLKVALGEEFEAIRNAAKKEFREEYQENLSHLQEVLEENKQLHELLSALKEDFETAYQRQQQLQIELSDIQNAHKKVQSELSSQHTEMEKLVSSHESLIQHMHKEIQQQKEDLILTRKQLNAHQHENQALKEQANKQLSRVTEAETNLAILNERSAQQVEMLNYVKSDLQQKKQENGTLIKENQTLQAQVNELGSKVASAQSSLEMAQKKDQTWIDILKRQRRIEKWSIKPGKSLTDRNQD